MPVQFGRLSWEQIETLVLDYNSISKPEFNALQIDMLEKLSWGK